MEQTGTGDAATTKVNEMGAEIIRLRNENGQLRTDLDMANGRVAVLEACINSVYDTCMGVK